MQYLLDTNTCIDAMRYHPNVSTLPPLAKLEGYGGSSNHEAE
jgi:predicted nucleic acid-binding protein